MVTANEGCSLVPTGSRRQPAWVEYERGGSDSGGPSTTRGAPTEETLGSSAFGVVERLSSYTTAGRLDTLVSVTGTTVLQELDYDYAARGLLEQRVDGVGERTETFAHDALARLTEVREGSAVRQSYTIDALGNLTDTHDGNVLYEDPTRPYAATEIDGPEGGEFAYDAVGNAYRAGELTLTYTQRNLPRTISSVKAGLVEYAYDASGARATKRGRDVDVTYFGAYEVERRGMQLYERLSISTPVGVVAQLERSASGPNGTRRLRWLLSERQGSVETTWASGETARHHRYDAYGGVLAGSGATTGERPAPTVSAGYTGHEHEDDIGLVNMGGRIYSPRLRRFLTADPVVANPFGQGLNAYSYVRGNPLNAIDPFGWQEAAGPEGRDPNDPPLEPINMEPEVVIVRRPSSDGSASETTGAGAAGAAPAQATDTERPGPPRGEGGGEAGLVDAVRTEIGNHELPWIFLFKSGPMERILLTHYVRERGAPLQLTRDMLGELTDGVLDVHDRSRSTPGTPNSFEQGVLDLVAAGGGVREDFHAGSSPNLNGVGEAGAVWDGCLDVATDGSWTFVGTVSLTDTWDFDARQWGFRGAELVNRVAAGALWGTPFSISSVRVPVSVSSASGVATFEYNRLPRGGRPAPFDLAIGAPFVWAWGVPGGVLTIFTGDLFPHPNQGSPQP